MTSTVLDSAGLATLCGVKLTDNLASVHRGLVAYGSEAGLTAPHRLVMYLAQVGHESADFRYDREVWDGKGAQARYDTRTDLGNTAAVDGDGHKNRGRTAMQITGGFNIREFRDWCRDEVDPGAPDFFENPDLMNTDPWEGLGPVWFWMTRNLNRYADAGDIKLVTKRINGGYNGLADRQARYASIALRVLGYGQGPAEIRKFQAEYSLKADGLVGPRTVGKLHDCLAELKPYSFTTPATPTAGKCPVPVAFRHWLKTFFTSPKGNT